MSTPIRGSIEKYLDHLRIERRLSKHTVAGYGHDLQRLCAYTQTTGLSDWRTITPYEARNFAAGLRRQGLSPRSIQRTLSACRGLFRFLLKQRQVKINPFSATTAPKAKKKLPSTLSVDQVGLLVAVAEREPLAIRDRAIMELFYSSGLRLSELTGLDLPELDLITGSARVTGKGSKQRDVPVGRMAIEAVKAWLPVRERMASAGEAALFVSVRGNRISPRAVQQRIKLWARKQGLDLAVHPHMLRHSFATHVLESSGELRAVQELLGHANISTTQVYTHLDFQHLAKVYDKSHPRARKPGHR